jgi:hypothetical protein
MHAIKWTQDQLQCQPSAAFTIQGSQLSDILFYLQKLSSRRKYFYYYTGNPSFTGIYFIYCQGNRGTVTLVLSVGYFLYTGFLGDRNFKQLFFIQCLQYVLWKVMNQVVAIIVAVKLWPLSLIFGVLWGVPHQGKKEVDGTGVNIICT